MSLAIVRRRSISQKVSITTRAAPLSLRRRVRRHHRPTVGRAAIPIITPNEGSILKHGSQRVRRQNADAAVGLLDVTQRFELAQDRAGGSTGDVRHQSDVFLSQ